MRPPGAILLSAHLQVGLTPGALSRRGRGAGDAPGGVAASGERTRRSPEPPASTEVRCAQSDDRRGDPPRPAGQGAGGTRIRRDVRPRAHTSRCTRRSDIRWAAQCHGRACAHLRPFVELSIAAAVTEKLLPGTGIVILPQRDVFQTAKEVAGLDRLSGGRFPLGVGVNLQMDEMRADGVDPRTRGARLGERPAALKVRRPDSAGRRRRRTGIGPQRPRRRRAPHRRL
ncbi:LLM class flavin-dependent oxidoreductase [Streptomyces sp. NPDC101151]|uniref:LLM class flavin-dependent oxidoreductase n=1 Tax=Streptomyces sp. NPDC101151 TaxID=3366115 RepID=UPI0037F5AC24